MKKIVTFLLIAILISGCGNNSGENKTDQSDEFVVGMECNYPPFNWQTSEESRTSIELEGSGYADGYDVYIANEIAKSLNKKLVIKKLAWNGLQPALESGEIDAIIAGMTADEKRERGMDFTKPYYESEMVILVRNNDSSKKFKGIQEFTGKTIVGQMSTSYDTVIDQIKGVNHATPKQSYPEMIMALKSEEVDGITAELPVAQGILETNHDLAIVRFDQGKGFDVDTSVSIGLKEGTRNTDLFKKVQECLNNISTEQRNKLMLEYCNSQPKGE